LAQPAFATDLIGKKDVVSYTVTLNSITPEYLPYKSGATATVEFSVIPKDQAIFSPKVVQLFVEGAPNSPFTVTGVETQGTYTVDLIEGTDLPTTGAYTVKIVVDNATSNTLPVTVWDVNSVTVANNPPNVSRTDLGIGEEVNLSIQPPVDPSIVVGWSNGGLGSLEANGETALFTASQSPGAPSITATISGLSRTIPFNVIAPSGISIQVQPVSAKFPNGGNIGWGSTAVSTTVAQHIGALTHYLLTLSPSTVNFYNMTFRENVPSVQVTLPNCTSNGPQSAPPFIVGQTTPANAVDDNFSIYTGIGCINNTDFTTAAIGWREQYLNAASAWTNFGPAIIWQASFAGTSKQTQMIDTNIPGSLQGPWY
jgi:hypothetical protein